MEIPPQNWYLKSRKIGILIIKNEGVMSEKLGYASKMDKIENTYSIICYICYNVTLFATSSPYFTTFFAFFYDFSCVNKIFFIILHPISES